MSKKTLREIKSETVKPDEVIRARERAGLTQKEAASLFGSDTRNWQKWEAEGIMKRYQMDYFCAVTGLEEIVVYEPSEVAGHDLIEVS